MNTDTVGIHLDSVCAQVVQNIHCLTRISKALIQTCIDFNELYSKLIYSTMIPVTHFTNGQYRKPVLTNRTRTAQLTAAHFSYYLDPNLKQNPLDGAFCNLMLL